MGIHQQVVIGQGHLSELNKMGRLQNGNVQICSAQKGRATVGFEEEQHKNGL